MVRLGLTGFRHGAKQLLGQQFIRQGADLMALAAPTGGNGHNLSGNPVGALIGLAIELTSHRMAFWCHVHGPMVTWCTTFSAAFFSD